MTRPAEQLKIASSELTPIEGHTPDVADGVMIVTGREDAIKLEIPDGTALDALRAELQPEKPSLLPRPNNLLRRGWFSEHRHHVAPLKRKRQGESCTPRIRQTGRAIVGRCPYTSTT